MFSNMCQITYIIYTIHRPHFDGCRSWLLGDCEFICFFIKFPLNIDELLLLSEQLISHALSLTLRLGRFSGLVIRNRGGDWARSSQ